MGKWTFFSLWEYFGSLTSRKTRFILGCGIIIDGVPRLLPMILDNKGKWIKKLV